MELAEQINHQAVANLVEVAKNQSIPLIHISTDYVFNGQESKPYKETDEANPQNIYGLTKLKGERAMKDLVVKERLFVLVGYTQNMVIIL